MKTQVKREIKRGVKELEGEIREARKLRLPWWAVLSVIVASFLCAQSFDHVRRLNLALPTLNCIGVLGFVIVFKWKLNREAWFWITMIIIAALHVLLLLFIPWTTKWVPALAIAGIDSVDFILILAILAIVGRLIPTREKPLTSGA